jgi:hypothetical protein
LIYYIFVSGIGVKEKVNADLDVFKSVSVMRQYRAAAVAINTDIKA